MLELYKKRLSMQGNYVGAIVKNNADMLMKASFQNDPSCKKCLIDGLDIWAKFNKNVTNIFGKEFIDYHVQFLPKVHYPIGTYIDIPDDTDVLQNWLIVDRDDSPQFVRYNVLKCNNFFRWIYGGKIYSSYGVLSEGGVIGQGSTDNKVMTVIDGDIAFIVPVNQKNKTITEDMRFLITENEIHPTAYKVIKVSEMSPKGLIKVTLRRDKYNDKTDDLELMVADYRKDSSLPVPEEEIPEKKGSSVINFDGEIKIGRSARTFSAVFYNDSGEELEGIVPLWSVILPEGKEALFEVEYLTEIGQLSIRTFKDYSLIGTSVSVTVSDREGLYSSTIIVGVSNL